jgi:hypothetical protein
MGQRNNHVMKKCSKQAILNLSRFRAAPIARLSPLSFESDGAFPALC